MYDEKMKGLQILFSFLNVICMFVAVVIQTVVSKAWLYCILCAFILLILTLTLISDVILKDRKSIFMHGFWYVCWFLSMIIVLFKMS